MTDARADFMALTHEVGHLEFRRAIDAAMEANGIVRDGPWIGVRGIPKEIRPHWDRGPCQLTGELG